MSRIRSKDTKPELTVRKFLFSRGFRYKRHDKSLPGKPDLVLPKYKTVIFIHGCFWHSHNGCKYFTVPKSNSEWWLSKLKKNVSNDSIAISKLESAGWRVITVWDCELKSDKLNITFSALIESLRGVTEA